eukprot:g680.t1
MLAARVLPRAAARRWASSGSSAALGRVVAGFQEDKTRTIKQLADLAGCEAVEAAAFLKLAKIEGKLMVDEETASHVDEMTVAALTGSVGYVEKRQGFAAYSIVEDGRPQEDVLGQDEDEGETGTTESKKARRGSSKNTVPAGRWKWVIEDTSQKAQ